MIIEARDYFVQASKKDLRNHGGKSHPNFALD